LKALNFFESVTALGAAVWVQRQGPYSSGAKYQHFYFNGRRQFLCEAAACARIPQGLKPSFYRLFFGTTKQLAEKIEKGNKSG